MKTVIKMYCFVQSKDTILSAIPLSMFAYCLSERARRICIKSVSHFLNRLMVFLCFLEFVFACVLVFVSFHILCLYPFVLLLPQHYINLKAIRRPAWCSNECKFGGVRWQLRPFQGYLREKAEKWCLRPSFTQNTLYAMV